MNYGRYEIISEIGKGAMGVVYEAYDPVIERKVALKVLRQDYISNKEVVNRFFKEAKAIGRLSHTNIVAVYDIGEDKDTIFIAMELLTGEPLNEFVSHRSLTIEEILDLVIQVADALDYAHKKGIVHRDIKPSNILVIPQMQIKITDFGIAHIEESSDNPLTQAGELLGTPVYMSPEQVKSMNLDGRSDLFSLGSILYELITNKKAFHRKNLAAVLNAVVQEEPLAPSQLSPEIPEDLSDIVMRCLMKDREERFSTGAELARALRGVLTKKETKEHKQDVYENGKRKKIFYSILLLVIFLTLLGGGIGYYLSVRQKLQADGLQEHAAPVIKGLLDIKSVPLGAQVIIDNKFEGKTPLRLYLPVGKHEVRVNMAGYYVWEAQVQLKEEKEIPLLVELIPIVENNP